jgi:hypothetical protein
LTKFSTDKITDETRNKRNVHQHNEGYISQTYSQHYNKWKTTEVIPTKIRNETMMSTFPSFIQCSFGIPSKRSKTRARNKRDSNREGKKSKYPYLQLICNT